jgi:hypothetical protein
MAKGTKKSKSKAERTAEHQAALSARLAAADEAKTLKLEEQNANSSVAQDPQEPYEAYIKEDGDNTKEAEVAADEVVDAEEGAEKTEEGTEKTEGDTEKVSTSVVAVKFKDKYIENAKLLGVSGKAARRSNWDWLSQQLASICLNDKHKIDIDKFLSVLDANGVDHSKWTNRNKGWEGRLRMTGRVALQKVVANTGGLNLGDEDKTVVMAPPEFVARFKTKEETKAA